MRTKIQGKSYYHPFAVADLKQPLTDDEKILAIKEKNWNLLIETHMRLGCSIAGRYVKLGGNSDEMVSAAMLGVCEAVDRTKQNGHENVTGYIIHYIHQYCSKALQQDCLIPVPRPSKKKITVCPITDVAIASDNKINELNEILESITKTEDEKMVIFLRQQNYTDYEISEKLSISRPTVTRIRHTLWERFNNV